ncbi:unnamed protein product [Coregonus sp. 'balchen']|nr:unnamed protein product [Coregonus sp. 'balchen']
MSMFRLRAVTGSCYLRRFLHGGAANRDHVLEQLGICSGEDQVLEVVGKNKAKLTVNHVGCAMGMLWQFQKEKPQMLRTVEFIKSHPEFLTLRVLAENKIELMDDVTLVDMLYNVLRLNVEPYDSLAQHLVSEAWLRLYRLPMPSLSKFAVCLSDQHLQHSPLMGQITDILNQKLSSIDDARILTTLMISVTSLVSPHLRDKLISKADHLLDTMDPSHYNNPRRMVQFLRNIKYSYRPLLEKCNHILLRNVPQLDAENISIIMGLYQSLQFNNCDFRLAAKQRLMELVDSSADPFSFTKLFVALGPMAGQDTKESFLLDSVYPYEVTMLTRVLSMLPSPRLDEGVISRVEAVLPQCNLNDLNTFAMAIAKWVRNDPSYRHNTPSKYVCLLQTLNRCGHERLRKADRLDLVLEELKYMSGEWFEEMLLEETMVTLQRLEGQISWTNVPEMALFLTRTNHLCTPLMDRIASVTMEHINKIHYSATYATLLPFAVLNYDPPRVDELFDICIQRAVPHISSFDPHLMVLLAYALAVADCFPEDLVREIFNVDFLAKLDSQLETLPDALNKRIRLRLMELNRAVCLECPESQVPWFHERYCQQLQKKGNCSISPVQQQIHKMLGEVLGGINCARVAVLTPYFYTVDFECVLDRHHQAVAYSEQSQLQISEDGKVRWGSDSVGKERSEVPPGAQRVAVDFLDSKSFCKNSRHMKGEAMMRKRHLEILGYHVVQIPHFEWNSMELSTQDAWKEYLRKKIFTGLP